MATARVIDVLLYLFLWLVVFRAILSWVTLIPYHHHPAMRFVYSISRFLHTATEPVLRPIRTRLPVYFGGVDFSPMVVVLGIIFLQTFVVNTLLRMADSLI
ncbi:YggT family protein [Desulfosarcina sp. OttesenSCG-928-B08]|nr:YggT family protein [Desulfosarcina sp. OttesenSCG-928-B08]